MLDGLRFEFYHPSVEGSELTQDPLQLNDNEYRERSSEYAECVVQVCPLYLIHRITLSIIHPIAQHPPTSASPVPTTPSSSIHVSRALSRAGPVGMPM